MRKLFLLIPALVLAIVTNAQTDFSSPYNCSADAGVISGTAPAEKVYLNETADPHQLEWSDVSQTYTAVISWTVNATQPCYIAASLDLGTAVSSNKHIFEVKVLDADGNEMGAVEEGPAYTGDGFTEANQVKALSGKILLPAAGNYTIELRNNRNFCKGSIKNVILSYAGAAPVTDFSTPYSCTADDATLVGEISNSFGLNTEADPHYIFWSDRALENPSSATWQIIVTAPCYVSASLDLGPVISSNKHIYEVRIFDANNAELGLVKEPGESTDANQVKALDGKILIPAAGTYTIELQNNRNFCKGSVKNVILSYAGAAPITDFSPPYTCAADDATFVGETGNSFKLYTESEPHYIMWSDRALAEPSSTTWAVQATRACYVSVSLDLGPVISSNKHIYEVRIYDANNTEVGMVGESAESTDADQVKALSGKILIPEAGNYTIELKNNRNFCKGSVKNVILTYAGAAPFTDFSTPYSCTADDATLVGTTGSSFGLNTEADPHYIFWSDRALANPSSTTWQIQATRACNISVSLDLGAAISSNKHIYEVRVFDANNTEVGMVGEGSESADANQVKVLAGSIQIPAVGNYTIELKNNRDYGKGSVKNVILSYAGGAVVAIPNAEIPFVDAILSTRAYRDADGLHFADAEHLGHISEEYAKWNISVAADGVYKFTANCNSSNYSNLTIQVLQGGAEKYSYTPQYTYSGEKEIKSPEWFLEAGNYELQLSNPANYSDGYLVSLSAAAVDGILIVDEQATDMTYINDLNGQSRKPLLKRSFKGGMYNTICFPFNNVTDAELANLFGEGYELLELSSATLNGTELNLIFANVNLSEDTYGRPYLIKPTHDVTNPLFNSHTIYKSVSHLTKECDAVDFIGSFIAGEVPAGENNLFLGPNDLLYFSQDATPIKGMRAYFHVKGAAAAAKRARIIMKENGATAIDLVNDEHKAIKRIENGQVVILRDGIRYNVMGTKLQ